MRRRTKSPKGPRASRGGRGRGRARGGSRNASGIQRSPQSPPTAPAKVNNTRRGANRSNQNNNNNNNVQNSLAKTNGFVELPSNSLKGGNVEGENALASPKLSSDFYLHKKFKKLTTTLTSEETPPTASCSSKPLELPNGLKNNSRTSTSGLNQTVVHESDSASNSHSESAIEISVIRPNCQSLAISASEANSSQTVVVGSSSSMVYKPKFRISTETETNHEQNDSSWSSSSASTSSSRKETDKSFNGESGKISKSHRLDRQSLDDRISKIIDENQSLLEWPEHFTKKLKSHTSRNTQSSSHNHQQRTNQLTIMSGGCTTELQPSNSNSSSTSSLQQPQNGLVRHSSFDMTSSGGTVEFMTNPLLLKAQSELLNSTFAQAVQKPPPPQCPSMSDLSFPITSATSSTLIVPKKRRRLSPTPSRLCGGEVSELPVNDASLAKNYYQNVDMNVRVNNCSGAKVTIRTNNSGNGGSVQSAVSFSRFIDTSVPSLTAVSNSLLYPSSMILNNTQDNKGFHQRDQDELSAVDSNVVIKGSRNNNKYPKKKGQSRPSKSSMKELALQQTNAGTTSSTTNRDNNGPIGILSSERTTPSFDASASLTKSVVTEPPIVSKSFESPTKNGTPFQVLQNPTSNPKRPTFLALKPVNNVLKKPEVGVLPSPETPRVAKSYNQMLINGNAYTYLGFKVSTRSSYTCLFKPQPMFIPQQGDPKLSMYSNWQPCPKDPKELETSMDTNDSRVNTRKCLKTLYTSASGTNLTTVTVSSPDNQNPISSPMAEKSPLAIFANGLGAPVTSLSRSSEAVPSCSLSSSVLSVNSAPSCSPKSPVIKNSNKRITGQSSSPSGSSKIKINNKLPPVMSSSSELSSADESSNFGRLEYNSQEREDPSNDMPLALTRTSNQESVKALMRDDSNSASDSMKSEIVMNRSESSRVRIMEGGFESNEDYTYIRGRGRGRYVCEACGIRCKKPSMLRKHLKTHTDLRPYTCKLCNFSFKTKGNLTKHQKSKSHHKKCISLGIHPESSQSLATLGPSMSDTNSDSDDDDDDCGDSDSQCEDGDATSSAGNDNDSESVEKEIAQSLLDLSKMSRVTPGCASTESEWSRKQKHSSPQGLSVKSMMTDTEDNSSTKPISLCDNIEAPIDLSVKTKPNIAPTGEPEPKRRKVELNGFVRSIGVVGEAQLWEPEEELIFQGCLNLKKVLNTTTTTTTNDNQKVTVNKNPPPQEIPIPSREIKQEVFEFPIENAEHITNGCIAEFSRKRKDSEASTSSVNSQIPNSGESNTTTTGTVDGGINSTASAASNSTQVKLHQPWLSPPERSVNKESEKEEDVVDEKPGNFVVENNMRALAVVNNGMKFANSSSSEIASETASPNSKLLSSSMSSSKPQAEFRQPSGAQALVKEDGKAECNVCGKTFARASQLTLHMNIHYLERPFRCDPCGVSFRTKGHLIKHRRSSSHDCKVYLTEAWGVANEENPRPFKCPDCKIAFRIHGHLAKHLRSKMHIMRMECLGKLPFGIYFEMEKSGMNLNEIDTTDCDMSLVSLQNVAKKIYGDTWMERLTVAAEEPA